VSAPRLSPDEAIRRFVQPGDRVLLGTGAGEARTLQAALLRDRERLRGLRLLGGLQLSDYAFMGPVRDGWWSYETWHPMPPIRDDVQAGRVGFHLVRGALVPGLIRALRPDVFLTVVSPPGPDGEVSFGASVSYARPMADVARRVLAEVHPGMPRVRGRTGRPAQAFDAVVDGDQPLPTHRVSALDPVSRRIAERILPLLPERPTVQIGLGSVPEALVQLLGEHPPPGLRVYGMGIDGMVPFLEAAGRPGAFVGGELLGTERLYRFAHDNPAIENYPSEEILAVPAVARIRGFVSLISAVEIDLTGQVNSEWAGQAQVSGVGGGFDFVDASWFAPDGRSILALRSTARGGTRSTIVSALSAGAPVTIPRHSIRFVVTEHGMADLLGLTVRERARALARLADPAFREELERAAGGPAPAPRPA
jgi:4-hydroxybutyrate CoA-transferase